MPLISSSSSHKQQGYCAPAHSSHLIFPKRFTALPPFNLSSHDLRSICNKAAQLLLLLLRR